MKRDPLLLQGARAMRSSRTLPGRNYGSFHFAARSEALAIEVDGDTHTSQLDYDLRRTAWLHQAGYRVLRFTNAGVMENLEGVATMITMAIEDGPSPQPSPRKGEGGCI